MVRVVAQDQFGVVEVVAGVQAHPSRQHPPQGDLMTRVQQADLNSGDLVGVRIHEFHKG